MYLLYSVIFSIPAKFALEIDIGFFFLIIFGFFILLRFIIPLFLRIEIASALDVVSFSQTPFNTSYIIACGTFDEKLDPQKIITKFKERSFIHPYYRKLKKNFHNILGIYFWREDPQFSLENHIEVLDMEFQSNEELYMFMNKEASEVRFIKNHPAWKIFILPNMLEKKSGFMMKIHHGLSDGLSLMSYLLNVGDSQEYGLVNLPKISSWRWILIYFIGIYETLKFAKDIILRKKDDNLLKSTKMVGKKNSYCSNTMDMKIIKTYAKSLGVSVNVVFLALLSKTLSNSYNEIFKYDLKNCSLMIAVSTTPIPPKNKFHPLGNNISFIPQDIKVFDKNMDSQESFQEYVKEINVSLKNNKAGYSIYIQSIAGTILYHMLPACINKFLMMYITNSHSGIYTSVPGPTTPITFFGHEVKEIFFFVTGIGHMRMVISILTYNGKFSLACTADNSTHIEGKILVEEFTKLVRSTLLFSKSDTIKNSE